MKSKPIGINDVVTVTSTLAELEQLRDRLGSFASMS